MRHSVKVTLLGPSEVLPDVLVLMVGGAVFPVPPELPVVAGLDPVAVPDGFTVPREEEGGLLPEFVEDKADIVQKKIFENTERVRDQYEERVLIFFKDGRQGP